MFNSGIKNSRRERSKYLQNKYNINLIISICKDTKKNIILNLYLFFLFDNKEINHACTLG